MRFDLNVATIAIVALIVAGSVVSSWMQQRDFAELRRDIADHQLEDRRALANAVVVIDENRTAEQRDLAALRIGINQTEAEFLRQLSTKVDQETRKAMLSDLDHRLNQMERHLEMNDTRLDVLMEERRARVATIRRESMNQNAVSNIHREAYAGMDAPNLSGCGSASAIAYSRKIRDRLRPLI